MTLTLLLFAALAIDFTYVRTTQFELHNAADAAAHAALVELRRSGDQRAATQLGQELGELNVAAGEHVTIDSSAFTYGEWDYASSTFLPGSALTNAVRVRADRSEAVPDGPVALLLGPMFEFDSADVAADAVGAFRSRDVMLVLDVTGSFLEEMNDAAAAVVLFLDEMNSRRLPNDRIGLNTFTGGSQMVTTLREIDGNYSSIRSTWYGDGRLNKDPRKTRGLTNCYQTACGNRSYCGSMYRRNIPGSWMQSCNMVGDDGVSGWTSQGPGLRVARQHLDTNDTYGNTKVIVLISDGRPTCPGYSNSENNPCALARAAYAYSQADAAYASGTNIFTVSMNTSRSTAQEAFMASLVRGYGKAYNTARSSDLQEILLEIAQSIPIALVE
ncbi:MAG: VWA domain-containing protein [Deltaproteobacteria bacterium]|nr:VWA domain-containing protein [Deltaproteobacteria bacterium]